MAAAASPDFTALGNELIIATKAENAPECLHLIGAGADLTITDKKGNTALTLASSRGLTSVVKALLDKGADINAVNNKGETALYWACVEPDVATIMALLLAGADLYAGTKKPFDVIPDDAVGVEAAMIATRAEFLLKAAATAAATAPVAAAAAAASVDKADRPYTDGNKLLEELQFTPVNVPECRHLIGAGANLTLRLGGLGNEDTALHLACGVSPEVALAILAVPGVDINARGGSEQTPLMLASSSGFTSVVAALLDHGANINAYTTYEMESAYGITYHPGETALSYACANSHAKTAMLLIMFGANPGLNYYDIRKGSTMNTPEMKAVKATLDPA